MLTAKIAPKAYPVEDLLKTAMSRDDVAWLARQLVHRVRTFHRREQEFRSMQEK